MRVRGGEALLMAAVCLAVAQRPLAGQEMDNEVFHYSALEVDALRAEGAALGRWEGAGWIGTDFDRLWWSTEGEGADGALEQVEAMALYGRYFRRFWDVVVGYRHDFEPVQQGYLTIGVTGLAPYWFEVGAYGFVSHRGEPSLRLEAETDLFVTQRLIASLGGELDWLLTDDARLGVGSGVAELEAGLRLRYEVRRKFAPYVDFSWVREKEPLPGGVSDVTDRGLRLGGGLRLIH